ncbi:thioredoxin family protein [Chryseobacterium salivictor]|uniref:Thioredoxin-like protein n=1 Tax=Chryseobacterium salivictor TaxID=2547600 RepID=A0A4P6ZCT0_9FLAO|nr:thioredoxin family protein [Chryseobacterium salivictor]QBO57311.1 Thioredoxin-like protein [Chryseobacterium salivictor]
MKKTSLILLVFFSIITFGQGMKFEENKTFKDLLALAKKENRLLFLDAYTTWCGPCKMMAKNVFPQASVGEFYNANFINSKIDMEKGEGIDIAKKYNVRAYPTYLFINGDGELIHRVTSYYDPEDFINVGKDAVDPSKQMGALKKKFEAGEKDPEFLKNFIKVYAYTDPVLASKVAKTYFDGKKANLLTQEDLSYLFSLTKDSNSPLFPEFISRKDELLKLMPEENYNRTVNNFKLNAIFNTSFDQTTKILDEKKFITEAKKIMSEEKANSLLLKAKMKIAASAKDTAAYQKYAVAYYKDGASAEFTWDELNSVSWYFFENITDKTALGKAILWAKQSVKLNEGYANTDTLANLYLKTGDKVNAKIWAAKAIELAKKEGEDYAETQALLNQLK